MNFLLLISSLALAQPPGTVLPFAPNIPPGMVVSLPTDLLAAARKSRLQGDLPAATRYYEAWLATAKSGRIKAAVQVALARVYEQQSDLNLAAALLQTARSGGNIGPWATYHLARIEYARGNFSSTASLCRGYPKNYPQGPHLQECHLLKADALAASGQKAAAASAYQDWLDLHPDSPLQESIQLRLAMATSVSDPKASIPLLQKLVLTHNYHSTGVTAQARLDELAQKGYNTTLPEDIPTLCQIADERRRCGLEADAWSRFESLQAKLASNPDGLDDLAAWIEDKEDDFYKVSGQYSLLADELGAALAKNPSVDLAWRRYKALTRSGRYSEAADALAEGAKKYGGKFSGTATEQARVLLVAGRYLEARDKFTALSTKEARWLAAYAAFRADALPDALTRIDAILKVGGDDDDLDVLAARYYRARVLRGLGRQDEAKQEESKILLDGPLSWYATLLRSQNEPPPPQAWQARAGVWPYPSATPMVLPVPTTGSAAGPSTMGPNTTGDYSTWNHTDRINWKALSSVATLAIPTESMPLGARPVGGASLRPDSYQPTFFYSPDTAYKLLDELGSKNPTLFPWAKGAADLAWVGDTEDAGLAVFRMYEAMDAVMDGRSLPEKLPKPPSGSHVSESELWWVGMLAPTKPATKADYEKIKLTVPEWRQVFLFVHDDHHTARFASSAIRLATNPEDRLAALRASYPTAYIDAIFTHAENRIDPLLVLGLMRQESVYRHQAMSPVGAIGLMQIMPKTGARVAALLGDPHYSPEILTDPSTNIRYGIWYLARLMDRFGNAFPMAVGSYNGGPHNMSAWLTPWGDKIRMDDYVEQIPYPETRDYVKKVTGYYATYVALYGEPGSRVIVPMNVTHDDRKVIDF